MSNSSRYFYIPQPPRTDPPPLNTHTKHRGTNTHTKYIHKEKVFHQNINETREVKCSAHNFIEFFGPNQKFLPLKMAEI